MQTMIPYQPEKPVNAAKRYLQEYRDIEGNLKDHIRKYNLMRNNLDKVAELFERATKATSSMNAVRVSGTPQHDGMANAVLEMIRLKDFAKEHRGDYDGALDYLLDDLSRLAREGEKRLNLINAVGDEKHKRLLFLRYICMAGWQTIARDMGYGVDNVYKLHGKALAEANRLL